MLKHLISLNVDLRAWTVSVDSVRGHCPCLRIVLNTLHTARKICYFHNYLLNLNVPYSDFNSLMRTQTLKKQWQQRWNSETQKKLHAIEPRVNAINMFRLPAEITIGHTYLTPGHLLRRETPFDASLVKLSGLLSIPCFIVYLLRCSR